LTEAELRKALFKLKLIRAKMLRNVWNLKDIILVLEEIIDDRREQKKRL